MKTILLNRKKCIGCAICADLFPDVFFMDEEDGKAGLIGQLGSNDKQKLQYPDDPEIDLVADKCPVNAIGVV